MFNKLLTLIAECAQKGFYEAVEQVSEFIFSTDGFMEILSQIGIIPEAIAHDSTEEKLFAKVSDAVLARAFRELGLKSGLLAGRADCADVIAHSDIHGYSLVADAKAFRLSRTAKNQKDFKVSALSDWRNDADYAVLCSPYFQYPRTRSQVYAQAIDNNVCLFSWEHLSFLLRKGIRESESVNLSTLWNFCGRAAYTTVVAERKECFIHEFNNALLDSFGLTYHELDEFLRFCTDGIQRRGEKEKAYWTAERIAILNYSREEAIQELLKSKRIEEKIRQIDLYVRRINRD